MDWTNMRLRPLDVDPTHCLIAGKWQPCESGQTLDLLNPSDGSTLCAIARGGRRY